MKLSISLKKKGETAAQPPPPKPKPLVFEDADAEESIVAPSITYNVEASKAMRKRMEAERKVDSTVYEYDEVWDRMQIAKQKQKEAKEVDALVRKPKYINSLLTAAATRKLDRLRAEEKMMQRERELEGDEFKDKDSFVTQGYTEQLEMLRKAEKEEKEREELEKKQRGVTTGMTHFYRKMLEESDQQHEATIAATEKRVYGPQIDDPSNLTIIKPPELTQASDLELARLARAEGKEVELNDDNQIVDKRDLLAAGLNLSLPNTRNLALQKTTGGGQAHSEDPQVHRAVGVAASRKEINERRARELRQQLEEEKRRAEEEKREEEAETLRRTVTKRNTTDDVQSARERYLQRKRARMEQQPSHDSGQAPS